MTDHDDFHQRLHHVRHHDIAADTGETPGMRRYSAISGTTAGSEHIWMGQTHVSPSTRSGNHHHGESETAIFVLAGNPVFVFLEGGAETRLETSAGDYVYVPPWVPHREENPDPDNEAVVVIARTTQEAIVVNLSTLEPGPRD